MPKHTSFTLEQFLGIFDQYCEDALTVEDRRWTRKENERMRDFCVYIESIYITEAEK